VKLYHWTQPQNLVGIATGGLEPHPPYDDVPYMTAGRSVVWLTANPSRDVSPADLEHIKQYTGADWDSPWNFGRADDVRLTVTFNSTNNRKLFRWTDWIAQRAILNRETGEQFPLVRLLDRYPPSMRNEYWISLNRIPVSQIEFPPITASIALLGLQEDSEPYRQLSSVPPDTIVKFAAAA
jgi:hypothetical protein